MENKFFVTTCRFHTIVRNKLLIIGWFYQNGIRENQLLVCLDRKKLPFTIEKVDMGRSTLKTKDGILITKQYFLWIDLPKSWKECKRLEVKNFYHGVGNTAFSVPVSNLKNIEGIMQRFIDSSAADEDGFEISGWYIDQGGMELSFSDASGQEYLAEVKQKDRPDVRKMYPENTEDEVVGFVAAYKGSVPKKIRVQYEDAHRYEETTVTLLSSPVQKGAAAVGTAYRKALVYYQQFGFTATVFRAWDKLSGREAISYKAWLKRHSPSAGVLKLQRDKKFEFSPKISIVVPLYKTPETYLEEMIESVRSQSYRNWELCLSDGSGEDSPIAPILKKYEETDERIKVVYNKEQLQISKNTNEALKVCTGDYIAFADHDDLLAPNALYECVHLLNKEPSTEIIYTDEDKIDMKGKDHFMPHFKSDFNIDMLCSTNYICHLFVVKREVYEKAGMLNPEFDGAQDYDLVLRALNVMLGKDKKRTKKKDVPVAHIPKVLYHWRCHEHSTSENPASKQYAYDAGKRALEDFLRARGFKGTVSHLPHLGFYRVDYQPDLIANRPDVAVVGGRLLDKKNKITGGIYTAEGQPLYLGLHKEYSGYMHRAVLQQEAEMVDVRCMRVSLAAEAILEEMIGLPYLQHPGTGRFDWRDCLKEDVDFLDLSRRFCDKVREQGYRIVWDPAMSDKID